ncbi:hypothetical protein ATANTOWER_027463 [Ataeniobius toweri]|uniref:Uncharacterized protein n=1 Tax=Ataeniobius toweri TaxID=208326 RepID=A0ABU7C426_9TELE|nr:hypothetical protein [Ataeniobius toweri]
MACTCIALYQVPRDPKALHATFSHPPIHSHIYTLTLVSYIVATAALGQTDRRINLMSSKATAKKNSHFLSLSVTHHFLDAGCFYLSVGYTDFFTRCLTDILHINISSEITKNPC